MEFPFPVLLADGTYEVKADDGLTTVATLRITAAVVALCALNIPAIANISVERFRWLRGRGRQLALTLYIDREDLFTVLSLVTFHLPISMAHCSVMKDSQAAARYCSPGLQTNQTLVQANYEKRTAIGQVSFTQESAFDLAVDIIAANDDVLVCDDLGDEWADFIEISTKLQSGDD